MNLLFFMSITIQSVDAVNLFKPFIVISENVDSYISNTNRIILFILGITVSANIYLYTIRNKISSSIMWSSKQIVMLVVNLIINLGILILGTSIFNYEIIYNTPILDGTMRNLLRVHISLNLVSAFLFILTLVKFIGGFTIDKNISNFTKKLNRRVYPKRLDILIRETKQITQYVDTKLTRFNQRSKITKPSYKNIINYLNKDKFVKIIKKLFYLFAKYILIGKEYLFLSLPYIKNDYIRRTFPLSTREIKKISLEIEILCQYLEYIIKRNSAKSIIEHSNSWNANFSLIIVMLFHINSVDKQSKEIAELYRLLLHNHSKLISATSESYENRKFHKNFIKSLLNGLAYREESTSRDIDKSEYSLRTSKLEEIYFDELFSLLMNFMQKKNFEIYDLLQNEKLSLNSFMKSNDENEKYYFSRSRKQKFEQLFISVLIKMIELNITDNITSVMAILLSLREEPIGADADDNSFPLSNYKTKKEEKNDTKTKREVNLSHENKRGLYYAFIKANELENYRAAGYIVKILSSNIEHGSIFKVMKEINSEKHVRNVQYDTGIYQVDFNDFSFEYCANKSFILLNVQYYYKGKLPEDISLITIYNEIDYVYLIKKLAKKEKEYNMISLDIKNLNSFKDNINKQIGALRMNTVIDPPKKRIKT